MTAFRTSSEKPFVPQRVAQYQFRLPLRLQGVLQIISQAFAAGSQQEPSDWGKGKIFCFRDVPSRAIH
jgi:hypothetical protein